MRKLISGLFAILLSAGTVGPSEIARATPLAIQPVERASVANIEKVKDKWDKRHYRRWDRRHWNRGRHLGWEPRYDRRYDRRPYYRSYYDRPDYDPYYRDRYDRRRSGIYFEFQ